MSFKLRTLTVACGGLAWFATVLLGQSLTTAVISGAVTDGLAPVAGATVTAIHEPSTARATTVSNSEGRFTLQGLIVGGPFTVTVVGTGGATTSVGDVHTQLGVEKEVRLDLQNAATRITAVVVEGDVADLDNAMTGAATTVTSARLAAQPTINRSFGDMIRTNPFASYRAGTAIVAVGQNNRFNSISVDGARINDQFGLFSSGLGSLANPLSLDAIEQISVSLAPFDIRRSGFTGAEINAVTKRGTNTFSGSSYYIYTDAHRQGPDVFGTTRGMRSPFHQRTSGLTFGGPILRDRLFFFVNYERFTQDSAASNAPFTPDAAALASVQARTAALTTVNMGGHAGGGVVRQTDTKRLGKLDWNISRDHRLSFRYSDTKGTNPSFGNFSATAFSVGQVASPVIATPNGITALSSNFFQENRVEKVVAGQLISNWTPEFKTQVSYSRTTFDNISGTPVSFPSIRIFGFPGVSQGGAAITDGALNFGTNESRQGNALSTRTKSYGANGDYLWRQFTFTAGADREETKFSNLFRQASYGVFDYASVPDFLADNVRGFARAIVQTGTPVSEDSAIRQTGSFGQVKWDASSRLNVTAGVRRDEIDSPVPVLANAPFTTAFGLTNTGTIDGTDLVAKRISFNYSVDRSRRTQVRGGVGEFLGRSPWVYLSNSYGNSGVGRFNQILTGTAAPTLASFLANSFDPANPIGTSATDPGGLRAVNLVTPGLKLPSMVRGNIAVDRKIERHGLNATIEYIHTESQDAFFIENINLRPTTTGADGRQRFAGSATAQPRIAGYTNVYRVRNISEGKSAYFNFTLERPMRGNWAWTAGYTHGRSFDAQNFGASTANSNWATNAVFNQNTPEQGRSDYEIRDRIQLSVSRQLHFFRNWATTVSAYYEGRSGSPYSWVYTGDLNTDGATANDLFFVPTGPADSRFDFTGMTAAQQTAYFDFINRSGLSRFAGTYVPRNAYQQPWQSRLDLRVVQEIPLRGKLSLELFGDFINFGALISRKNFNYIETLPTPTDPARARALGNASYTPAGLLRPTITTDANNNIVFATNSIITPNNTDARWRIQMGARLKF